MKTYFYIKKCVWLFKTGLCKIVQNWTQPTCLAIGEIVNSDVVMKYYCNKINELLNATNNMDASQSQ